MTRCVVLLRGVNVGRANRVAMADFRRVLERLGARDVVTYVQSGNAVVGWDGTPGELETAAHSALAERALSVPVMVRTADELARVVAASPWGDELDPTLFHVAFLSGQPDPERVAAIDSEALLPERVVVGERVLYLDHARGVRSSRLARLDLGVAATARNWRTVTALLELARSS